MGSTGLKPFLGSKFLTKFFVVFSGEPNWVRGDVTRREI